MHIATLTCGCSSQTTLNQEMLERRAIESRINASHAQAEQETIDLERLRNLLNQV
jgi:hypothetical protein